MCKRVVRAVVVTCVFRGCGCWRELLVTAVLVVWVSSNSVNDDCERRQVPCCGLIYAVSFLGENIMPDVGCFWFCFAFSLTAASTF